MSMIFTEDRPHEGSFVVYFNGVEVPVQSIQVQMGVGEIPRAFINMAPDKELQRLGAEDRVQVATFYLDDTYTEMSGVDPDFRLLFEGDIVGWQYTNSSRGRSLQFTAVNFLKVLNELYMAFIQGLDSLVTGTLETLKNPAKLLSAHFGPTFPVSLLYAGLNTEVGKLIRRPYDLVENALRACTGSLEQNKLGAVAATNFFARYMRRTGFLDRFVPSPLLEIDHMRLEETDPEGVFPLLRYVREQGTLELFKMHMNQMANESVWTIINDLFSRMYYEILAFTTAPIAQVNFTGPGVKGDILGPPDFTAAAKKADQEAAVTKAALSGNLGDLLEAASGAVSPSKPNRILNYVTKPQWLFGVPPACNVIFPSMYEQFTFTENYDEQPTRMYMNNNWIVNSFQKGAGGLNEFAIPHAGYPRQVQQELDKRYNIRGQGNETVSGKNFLVWPEEYFKGPRVREGDLPKWFMMLFQNANRKTNYAVKNPPIEIDQLLRKLDWPVSMDDGALVKGATDPVQQSFFFLPEDREPTEEEKLDAKKQKLSWLQQVYARYEYQRQRAAYRNGAVNGMFNPYLVPGFPTVIFDELTTGNHVFGYAVSVTHDLSAEAMRTSMSFSLAQTLDDYLHQILNARVGANPELRTYIVSAAPPNPIPEVRAVTQVLEQAEEYFTTLFHQRQIYRGGPVKTAAFDIFSAINLVLKSGQVVGIDVQDLYMKGYLDKYTKVIPSNDYDEMFRQAQAAMRFTCRPVCTLEEYISFQEKGIRKGKVYPDDKRQGKGAVFYEEILDLIQGPGEAPTLDENNVPQSAVVADTRADWRQRLINYRTKFLFQLHPQED